ncbi:hypothetical protein [Lacticaseibacillus daqingensis]|uniref:hypothetical protein n=1 Tax=Lacticaseibacillus daqingensis TaxID=2486014 RepID=UPI000F789003|nr:hypothetical protein [Lacticaseibacillus daqingensis]
MMLGLLLVLVTAMTLAVFTLCALLARLLTIDATARHLPHPKLIGVLAAGAQNGSGLLAYLALRRSHPIDAMNDHPQLRERLKVGSLGTFAVLLVSGLCALLVLLTGQW